MNKLYHVFPSVLSSSTCDDIINRGLQLESQSASIGFNNDRVDNSYRISTIRWFNPSDNKDIVNTLMHYASYANREYFGFDVSFGTSDIQFTEYHGSTGGKYDWHHDVWWENPRPHDRKLSVVIQLSQPTMYDGGNFEFKMPHDSSDLSLFKARGSILVFPSFFEHRVLPVTSGTRYSLVTWVDGPKFR